MSTSDRSGGGAEGLLGKEQVFQAREELGEALVRRFGAAIGYRSDPVVPPTLIFELTYDIEGPIDPNTGLYGGLHSWAGSPRQLERAGNEYQIFQPARADDVVTVHRKIVDVAERQGKTGTWTFVTTEIQYTNQRNELLGTDRETLACRY